MVFARSPVAALLACGFVAAFSSIATADDTAWLRDNGTLIFKDTFDREEDGNLAAALGNGWNSATANRVPDIKQADLDVAKRRDPYLKSGEKLPEDLQALLDSKMKFVPWQPDNEWHTLVVVTEGDEMRVTLDGKPLGSHRSQGFLHPMKRWFSLGINPTAWVDEVEVWKVK